MTKEEQGCVITRPKEKKNLSLFLSPSLPFLSHFSSSPFPLLLPFPLPFPLRHPPFLLSSRARNSYSLTHCHHAMPPQRTNSLTLSIFFIVRGNCVSQNTRQCSSSALYHECLFIPPLFPLFFSRATSMAIGCGNLSGRQGGRSLRHKVLTISGLQISGVCG